MQNPLWLLIDVGNTHTVAGIYPASEAGAVWAAPSSREAPAALAQVRYRTDPLATADEYRSQLFQLFSAVLPRERAGQLPPLSQVVVSSVVPSLNLSIRRAFEMPSTPVTLIDALSARDFDLDLPHPEQLGADRLANIAGALLAPTPTAAGGAAPFLIVDAGTATTFCLVAQRARPTYVGGAIVPGLEISWRALVARAAKLSSVPLERPASTLGTTTETQIQSGVLQGYEALIEGMTDRLLKDADQIAPGFSQQARLIATGGCINLLSLSPRFSVDPDLTLKGLLRYGQLRLESQP